MGMTNCSLCGTTLPLAIASRRDGCRFYLCPECERLYDLNPTLFKAKIELLKIKDILQEERVLERIVTLKLPDGAGLNIRWDHILNMQQGILTEMIRGNFK